MLTGKLLMPFTHKLANNPDHVIVSISFDGTKIPCALSLYVFTRHLPLHQYQEHGRLYHKVQEILDPKSDKV